MKNPGSWTLDHSDTLAHFIQVHGQLVRSRWYAAEIRFTTQGGELLGGEFPDLEQFVFAAVYFRQLFARRDQLLNNAVECYGEFVDCPIRGSWVREEEERFDAAVNACACPLTGCTRRELFEACLYGAGLLHKFPGRTDKKGEQFLDLHDDKQRYVVLFALHGSLRTILNHVGHLAVVIRRDFAHWQTTYSLPPPDVRWHDRLFNLTRSGRIGATNE
jgi:hypothetical protein